MLSNKQTLSILQNVSKLKQVVEADLAPGARAVVTDVIASLESLLGGKPTRLTDHFTLEEFLASVTAVKHNLTLKPNGVVFANLKNLCERVLEPARLELGQPIYVSSGYRSDPLNRLVGGVPTSHHLTGRAADVTTSFGKHDKLFEILSALPHVELIDYKTFIHVAL